MMTTLIIARHCESTWHVEGRLTGQKDEAVLTGKGKADALELAGKLESFNVNSIYSFKLKRAIQTARIIGKHLKKGVTQKSSLNERSWGSLEGKLDSEIQNEMKRRFNFTPSFGESYQEFEKRITNCLLEIVNESEGKTVLVITHGRVKEVIERLFKGLATTEPSLNVVNDLAIILRDVSAEIIKERSNSV